MAKQIVVLGAGYAGILIAKKLEKRLRKKDVDITIIDKNPFHTMLTELHEVAAWRVDEENIRLDIKKIFAGRKVNVVQDHIMKMFRLASSELDPERKKKMLNFYVVGGGFTGVEMAGELAEFTPVACKKFNIDQSQVRITLVDVMDNIIPYLPEKAIRRATKRLEKMGVTLKLKTKVTGVTSDSIEFSTENKQGEDLTSTVIWVAGTEGSDIVSQSEELGIVQGSRGRIQTDKFLRCVTHPNVYIAGDNIYFIPEGEDNPVPQMVENCEACAPVIAKNIISEVEGKKPEAAYKPSFHGEMVSIGGGYGTANVGVGNMKFVLPSFLAMLSKHFINIIYFIQALGWHKVFNYIRSQFFTIRNKRSFVGGHLANRAPTFFSLPLRLFAGVYMLYFGYRRIQMGWLSNPVLRDLFYDVAGEFRPIAPFPLTDITIFDRLRLSIHIVDNAMTVWFRSTPMNWFLQTFVVSSDSTQIFFQVVIVVFEILIGLALIAGLFTTLASVGAIVWAAVIFATVGINIYTMWIPFAAIAFCFTGGRVLALDYYVMPWLAERWKRIGFVKKWYLYN